MIPIEDPVLQKGSNTLNPDGSTTPTTTIDPETGETVPIVTHLCPHNEAFFANPDYESILQQQQQEMINRAIAAQQAAEQAAAAQEPTP